MNLESGGMLGVAVVRLRRLSAGKEGAGGIPRRLVVVVGDLFGSKPGFTGIHQAEGRAHRAHDLAGLGLEGCRRHSDSECNRMPPAGRTQTVRAAQAHTVGVDEVTTRSTQRPNGRARNGARLDRWSRGRLGNRIAADTAVGGQRRVSLKDVHRAHEFVPQAEWRTGVTAPRGTRSPVRIKHTEVLARRTRADCRQEHIPSTSRRHRAYPERRVEAESVRIEKRRQHDLGGGAGHWPNQPKGQDWRSRRQPFEPRALGVTCPPSTVKLQLSEDAQPDKHVAGHRRFRRAACRCIACLQCVH